jgi:glucose dehydrogenase
VTQNQGRSPAATGAGWGASWVIDQKTGIAYVNTGNKGPYDGPCAPGPDLWAASKMALNDTNGNWIWAFQTTAHDTWDYDCSWQQALGNETISGVNTEVMWGTCKNGYLYELNALTGRSYGRGRHLHP